MNLLQNYVTLIIWFNILSTEDVLVQIMRDFKTKLF
jgi:hypothetical protein